MLASSSSYPSSKSIQCSESTQLTGLRLFLICRIDKDLSFFSGCNHAAIYQLLQVKVYSMCLWPLGKRITRIAALVSSTLFLLTWIIGFSYNSFISLIRLLAFLQFDQTLFVFAPSLSTFAISSSLSTSGCIFLFKLCNDFRLFINFLTYVYQSLFLLYMS